MDDLISGLAREMAEAIAAALARDPGVEACKAKAKASGFELQVSLEAVVGLVARGGASTASRVSIAARPLQQHCQQKEERLPQSHHQQQRSDRLEMTAADRRFLRSLRIAADEAPEEV